MGEGEGTEGSKVGTTARPRVRECCRKRVSAVRRRTGRGDLGKWGEGRGKGGGARAPR